jgi:hypothetical protein
MPSKFPERKITEGGTKCRQEEMAVNMRMLAGLALASILALATMPVAHADEFDQATRLHFSEAVRIPGRVLPAGTYWFVLNNHGTNPGVVQIFKADRITLVETLQTIGAQRMETTDSTVLTFAEPDSSSNSDTDVPALTKWFYPDQVDGHEFIYSNQSEKEFRHEKEVVVPTQPRNNGAVAGD